MTFASRDAFPARGGVDDKPDRFPLSPRPSQDPSSEPADGASRDSQTPTPADQPCGSIGTKLAPSCDSSVTDSPLPSGLGSPGWVGARDGTPGPRMAEKATS